MASFDRTVSIKALPEEVWRAVKSAVAQQGEVTAEKEMSLLVIRRGATSLVYFLQAQERSSLVSLRHIVTTDVEAGAILQTVTDIPAALDTLPGGSTETDSLEAWPARRRLEGIISAAEGTSFSISSGGAAEGTARMTAVERASLRQRFFAYVIDSIILGFVSGLISPLSGGEPVVLAIIGVALPAIYFIWPYSTSGQTLGKHVLGIKVVSIDGSPLNWGKGILRTVGYILSTIPLGFGFLWAIWDADKQAGHDKIAGTCVVPASVTRLQGTVEPSEVGRRQRRWLIGLGIPTLLIGVGFLFLFWRGVAEVREMGPWPSSEVSPEELVKVDLSHLGLEEGQIQNARDDEAWSGGSYEEGVLITYELGTKSVVALWALRYETTWAAGNDYNSAQAWAWENCGFSTYMSVGNSGVIDCQFNNGYDKIFWNDYWIVDIVALEGTEFTSEILVNQVRDAIAAHWRTIVQS